MPKIINILNFIFSLLFTRAKGTRIARFSKRTETCFSDECWVYDFIEERCVPRIEINFIIIKLRGQRSPKFYLRNGQNSQFAVFIFFTFWNFSDDFGEESKKSIKIYLTMIIINIKEWMKFIRLFSQTLIFLGLISLPRILWISIIITFKYSDKSREIGNNNTVFWQNKFREIFQMWNDVVWNV